MTKVSADRRPRKDYRDAVKKALPIQNLVMVWWQRLELQRRGLCKCLLIKWAENSPESNTLKCFGRWGILPLQQQSLKVVVVVSVCRIASGLGAPGCIVGGHRGARRWRPADGTPDTIQRKHRTGSRRVKEKGKKDHKPLPTCLKNTSLNKLSMHASLQSHLFWTNTYAGL